MKNKNDPKKSRKNIISQSVNSSFSKSSFIELRDGTIKRIRHKQSYKDLFLEKQNFVPTEMPHSKRRDGSYSSMYQNRNSFISSSEENSLNEGNKSLFSKNNIKTIDNSFSNSQKRLKRISFANNLRNKLHLSEKKNLMKRKIKKKIGEDEDVDTNNILAEIQNEDESNFIHESYKTNQTNLNIKTNNSKVDYPIIKDEEIEEKKDIENLVELKKTLDSTLIDVKNNKDDTLRFSKNSNTLKSDYRKSNKTLLNDDSFFSKEIDNIIEKRNSISGDFEFFNGETGEKLNNMIISLDPLSGKESFLFIEGPKDENGNYLPFKKNEYIIKKNSQNEDSVYDKKTGQLLNSILVVDDPLTGRKILINKNTKEKIKNLFSVIDLASRKESFVSFETIYPSLRKIMIYFNPILKKNILIDEKGIELENICLIKDTNFGDSYLYDKEKQQKLKNVIKNYNPENGKEFFIQILNPIDDNGNEIPVKITEFEVKKDQTDQLKLINCEDNKEIDNIIPNIDSKTGEIMYYNKKTGDKINNIIKKINGKNGKTTYIKYDININKIKNIKKKKKIKMKMGMKYL